jgi:hypothetical protein
MRQIIIRSLATAGVVVGVLFTGVGVAAAQPELPLPAIPEGTLPAPPELALPNAGSGNTVQLLPANLG